MKGRILISLLVLCFAAPVKTLASVHWPSIDDGGTCACIESPGVFETASLMTHDIATAGPKKLNTRKLTAAPAPVFSPALGEDFVVSPKGPDAGMPALVSLNLDTYNSNPHATEAVAKSMNLFTERLRNMFRLWLSRSSIYLPMMMEILKEEGVPDEMAYLPLIESGFNPKAFSRKKAAGPWQFIAATGKRYGLKINKWVDERRDPVKSTRAAAQYLKDLYKMFGSWSLAMAAYNAGEGKIMRGLAKLSEWDYWGLHKTSYIKPETKSYVPHFIAARLIAANPGEYGFHDVDYRPDFSFDEVAVNAPLTIEYAAKCAETTVDKIKELNPELKRGSTPPNVRGYMLRVPKGAKEAFLRNSQIIPAPKIAKSAKGAYSDGDYIVKKGDSLWRISKKTGVPVKELLAANGMGKNTKLRIGQKLEIPD